jgi:hypothetical protein
MMTVGAESHALGHDPLYDNPQHPWNKKLNYPRIWHLLFALNIDRDDTNLIGSISVILFFIGLGLFFFSKRFDNLTIFIITLIVLSPSVMLGIERGNIELVIFLILSSALLIGYSSSTAALSLLVFASILKLYPVFTFVYLLKEHKKKFWFLFLTASAVFIIYVLFTLGDIKQVYLSSPKMAKSAYGLNVIWMGLTHPRILNLHVSESIILAVRILSYIMLGVIIIGTLMLSFRTPGTDRYKQGEFLDAFRIGAGIYIGCFILGNNFDYRFTFLIFTIPQLAAWMHDKEKGIISVPLITLLATVFSLWNYVIMRFLGGKITFVMEEFSNWIILAGLLYLFFCSLPDWLSNYLSKLLLIKKQTSGQVIASH